MFMIKILAIGNSFSQDATALLQRASDDLYVRNLYIGGCSLERHCENIRKDKREYVYEEDGAAVQTDLVSIRQALSSDKWDYVTLQQSSGLSGIEESFYPHLSELVAYVKKFASAEIVLHRTWAYEIDSAHEDFVKYDRNQTEMWNAIKKTYDSVAARENMRIIDSGGVVQDLRSYRVFDYKHGGLSLTRDGFHLSFNYGRFVAAAVWCKFFTGEYPEIKSDSRAFQTIKEYFKAKAR